MGALATPCRPAVPRPCSGGYLAQTGPLNHLSRNIYIYLYIYIYIPLTTGVSKKSISFTTGGCPTPAPRFHPQYIRLVQEGEGGNRFLPAEEIGAGGNQRQPTPPNIPSGADVGRTSPTTAFRGREVCKRRNHSIDSDNHQSHLAPARRTEREHTAYVGRKWRSAIGERAPP